MQRRSLFRRVASAFVLTLTSNPGAADFLFELAPRIAASLGALYTAGHADLKIIKSISVLIADCVDLVLGWV